MIVIEKLTKVELEQCSQALATSACVNLRKSTRAVTRWFDEELEPCGLRSTQLAILLIIAVTERPTQSRVARDLVMDNSTVSRNLKLLEGEGLIRTTSARSSRFKIVSLTPKGMESIREAIPLWARTQKAFVAQFGEERWDDVLDSLARTISSVRVVTQSTD